MKKFLVFLGSLVVILLILFLIFDESRPEGEKGARAEQLTDKMFASLNKSAWDSLAFIRWTFRDEHRYIWDKANNRASISWGDYQVLMNLNEVEGKAYQSDKLLKGSDKDEAIQKAWSYWCNDSFWLIAPFKAKDPGTSRKYVDLADGLDGLLIEYESGGVTPGDAYLWALNDSGVPEYYKMWVSIIPIGGVKATWRNWKEFEGVKISTEHKLGPMSIPIGGIRAGNTLNEIGLNDDLFSSVDP
mgnify:CR=1 FL=1